MTPFFLRLDQDWVAKRAGDVQETGEQLSASGSPQHGADGWLPAVVPGTVLTTLVKNGVFPEPFYGLNSESIPDIGAVGRDFYTFWFCTRFNLPKSTSQKAAGGHSSRVWLLFRGINYSADVYVNGRQIPLAQPRGMFLRHRLDVTDVAQFGRTNKVAVLVHPPDHPGRVEGGGQGGDHDIAKDVSAQYVEGWDWIIPIRDRNTGMWDEVALKLTGPVVIQDTHLVSVFTKADLTEALLHVSSELKNASKKAAIGSITVIVSLEVEPDLCLVHASQSEDFKIGAGETITHTFTPLKFTMPQLWWPNGLGEQPLYTVEVTAEVSEYGETDSWKERFGFRQIVSTIDPSTRGRLFRVNQQPVFIRGGNWIVSDGMLRLSKDRYATEVSFHADANLNMIRVWGGALAERPEFYDACDERGILVWQEFWITGDCNGRGIEPSDPNWPLDHNLFLLCARDTVKLLRNHPSLALWVGGNETTPPEDLNSALIADLRLNGILPQSVASSAIVSPPSGADPKLRLGYRAARGEVRVQEDGGREEVIDGKTSEGESSPKGLGLLLGLEEGGEADEVSELPFVAAAAGKGRDGGGNAEERGLSVDKTDELNLHIHGNDGSPRPNSMEEDPSLLLDGTRPYIQGSLWDGFGEGRGAWSDGPYNILNPEDFYTSGFYPWGFNPEIGNVGMPEASTIRSTFPSEYWSPPEFKVLGDGDIEEIPNRAWDYHTYIPYSKPGMVRDQIAMYGLPTNLDDFCNKAQLVNYVQYRALIESWNSRMWTGYTGVLIWKTQNPWPGLRGQLYDWQLDVCGGLFGVRAAAEPVHVQINLHSRFVEVVNSTAVKLVNVSVRASVYNLDGTCPDHATFGNLTINPFSTSRVFQVPDCTCMGASDVYFLLLSLCDSSESQLSRNFYWMYAARGDYTLLDGEFRGEKVKVGVEVSGKRDSMSGFNLRVKLTNQGKRSLGNTTKRQGNKLELGKSAVAEREERPEKLKQGLAIALSDGQGEHHVERKRSESEDHYRKDSSMAGSHEERDLVRMKTLVQENVKSGQEKEEEYENDGPKAGPGVAFFIRMSVRSDDPNGGTLGDGRILGVRFSDNYVSLVPGETMEVDVKFKAREGENFKLSVKGWNVDEQETPILVERVQDVPYLSLF